MANGARKVVLVSRVGLQSGYQKRKIGYDLDIAGTIIARTFQAVEVFWCRCNSVYCRHHHQAGLSGTNPKSNK